MVQLYDTEEELSISMELSDRSVSTEARTDKPTVALERVFQVYSGQRRGGWDKGQLSRSLSAISQLDSGFNEA